MVDRWITFEQAESLFHVTASDIIALANSAEIQYGPNKAGPSDEEYKTVLYDEVKSRFPLRDKLFRRRQWAKDTVIGLSLGYAVSLIPKEGEDNKTRLIGLRHGKYTITQVSHFLVCPRLTIRRVAASYNLGNIDTGNRIRKIEFSAKDVLLIAGRVGGTSHLDNQRNYTARLYKVRNLQKIMEQSLITVLLLAELSETAPATVRKLCRGGYASFQTALKIWFALYYNARKSNLNLSIVIEPANEQTL